MFTIDEHFGDFVKDIFTILLQIQTVRKLTVTKVLQEKKLELSISQITTGEAQITSMSRAWDKEKI